MIILWEVARTMASATEKVEDLEEGATEMVQAEKTSDWDSCWNDSHVISLQLPQYL